MNNINLESQFIGTGKTNNQIIENKIIRESDQQFAVRDIQRLNEIIEENYTIEELLEIVERAVNCANCRKSIWIGGREHEYKSEECIWVCEGWYCKNCWSDAYADYTHAWDNEEVRI